MSFAQRPRTGQEFAQNAQIIDHLFRQRKKLSQKQAAAMLGISQPMVSRYLTFARRWPPEAKRLVVQSSDRFSFSALYRFTGLALSNNRARGQRLVKSGSLAYRYVRKKSLLAILERYLEQKKPRKRPQKKDDQALLNARLDLAEARYENKKLAVELKAAREVDQVAALQKKMRALLQTIQSLRAGGSGASGKPRRPSKGPDVLYLEESLRVKLGVRVDLWPEEKRIVLDCMTPELFEQTLAGFGGVWRVG